MRDDQRRQLTAAALKVIGVAVGVGVVIALGAFVMVKALGFSDSTPSAHSTGPERTGVPSQLPTVALSSPGSSESASASPSATPSATPTSKKRPIVLAASPVSVGPGQRINLTGSYPGQDNLALQVQREENGAWTPFADVTATVRVGTFGTYVLTSRTGDNRFRMFDPGTGKASNPVTVSVG